MESFMQVLASLVFASFVVNAQDTIPYLRHENVDLGNHSYLEFNHIGITNSGSELRCRTDLATCCNNADGPHRGDWFYPNGSRLAFGGDNSLNFLRRTQEVNMNRFNPVESAASGIYQCTIETNAVNSDNPSGNMTREIIYIGLYTTGGGGVRLDGGIEFEEFTDENGETSHYDLTSITINGPPTIVNWTIDSEFVGHGVRILNDPVTARYTNTLTVQGRREGEYLFNVFNVVRQDFTRLTVIAPDSPSNLQVEQNGITSVLVLWTLGNLTHPTSATGYTISLFPQYPHNNTVITKAVNSPTETSTTVAGLVQGATYFVIIVANSVTLTSNVTGPRNVTIETVEVSVSSNPESPVMRGDTVSLHCSAVVPPGLGESHAYQWSGPNGVLNTENTADIDNIAVDQAGQYMCTVIVEFFNVSEAINVTIQIEAPIPTIEASRDPPLYEGTSFNLSCTSDELNTEGIASSRVEWCKDGNLIDTSPGHLSIVDGTLSFRPLTGSDNGSYICSLIVTPINEYVVISNPQQQSPSSNLQVEGFPAWNVSAMSDSQVSIGDQIDLDCTVTEIPYLITLPMLEWVMGTTSLATGSGYSLPHTLTVDRTSQAGVYSCEARIEVSEISLSAEREDQTSVNVQMPQPGVTITPDRSGTLYAGTTFTMACTVTLNLAVVDTPTNVTITWTGPRPILGEWYQITDTVTDQMTLSRNLSISPLSGGRDNGEYTCTAIVTGGDYILGVSGSQSFTVDVTSPPELMVSIGTSGVLLTGQNYEFVCSSNVVEDLIPLLVLELLAPNGVSLDRILSPQSNTLRYTLPSIKTSDSGGYTCLAMLAIPGSGVNSTATAIKHITIVDAYPVGDISVNFKNTTGLDISWDPPAVGQDLTTNFTITCLPLLVGIPIPGSTSTGSGSQMSITLARLHPGVSYNCSIVTVTTEGQSTPEYFVESTVETAPSGPPLSPHVIVGVTEVTFTWALPEVTHRNGQITGFTLSCLSNGGSLAIRTTFSAPGTYTVEGFAPGTLYNCSVVASNSKGNGPPAVIPLTTQEEPTAEGFNLIPVVAGVVAVVFIIAVTVIVIVVVLFIARKRRHKVLRLNRGARPNSYIRRTADSQSATIRANPHTGEGSYSEVKAGAKGIDPVQEYEMERTYSQPRPVPGLPSDDFDITANKHITSEIDGMKGVVLNPQYQMLPCEINGAAASTPTNPQYEMIENYSRVGGASENVYEVPKGVGEEGGSGPVPKEAAPYAEPKPRHNTMNQPPRTAYSVPRSRNYTVTQGVPSPRNSPASTYSQPKSRQNKEALPPLPLPPDQSPRAVPNPYDRLGGGRNTDPATKPSPETEKPDSSEFPKK